MDSLVAVEKEIDKALDLFENFYDGVDQDINQIIDHLVSIINDLTKIESEQTYKLSADDSISMCREQVRELIKNYSDKHKDLHANISKIGKVIDKNFVPDYGNMSHLNLIDTAEKKMHLNQAICEHLLRSGHLEVCDTLVDEAGLVQQIDEEKKRPFIQMNFILSKLKEKDVYPALEWCQMNSKELKAIHSNLEFKLHRLRFIQLVQQGPKAQLEVLKYSRNFTQFANECSKEIQRLMGSLIYMSSGLDNSPYSSYLGAELWEEIEEEFIKNSCKLMGLPVECPLDICINTGCKALPALVNIVQVMQQTQCGHILSKDELPIEIEIGQNYRFHSVFSCPILRQQTTDLNPPMRLVCGHVISKDALTKLNNSGKTRIKCPYCPVEQSPSDAKQMLF
ncbi:RMD5 -like protein [Brachionus plicatilis]|uniref:RMD5-like protein n=1 Tax=Brachionus plicatilis TaxID=10195 RepID=A0A3M7SW38_BRAPC|nr:RMD5 -like protein [Brachionus plicatilis]